MENRDASITTDWADGTYTFRLGWGELGKLQEACDAGPWYLHAMFRSLLFHVQLVPGATPEAFKGLKVEAIREIIRWGLVGGGMKPEEALKKVRLFVEGRPPDENISIALKVLEAGMAGAPEEQIEKKSHAPASELTTSPTANSGSESSTELGESSASRRSKSTRCPSGSSSRSQPASAMTVPVSPQERQTTSGNG